MPSKKQLVGRTDTSEQSEGALSPAGGVRFPLSASA